MLLWVQSKVVKRSKAVGYRNGYACNSRGANSSTEVASRGSSPFRPPLTRSRDPSIWTDFAVSIWGRDFDPEVHAIVVRNGLDVEYSPTVDVFLPVCNEPTVLLANTWNHVLAMDYPHVTVHVLDDGAKDEVKALAGEYGFQCE